MCRHRSTTERPHRSQPVRTDSRAVAIAGSGEPPWENVDELEEEDDIEETILKGVADMCRLLWIRMDRMEQSLMAAIKREND